jgi:glycolate oxidase iron-sulfur subunit
MQTNISEHYRDTTLGREADAILRACVHCGFCTATCPTYQLLGDELDGPRGRIYQIKAMLEGDAPTAATRLHLDRCLTCRACETTCPSGVKYGRLVDIGRELLGDLKPHKGVEAFKRRLLRAVLPHPRRFAGLLFVGQRLRPLLPAGLRAKVPPPQPPGAWPRAGHARRMLVLDGCVQQSATPATNAAAARLLDKLGINLLRVPQASCCGAVSQHLGAGDEALARMRANIDAWWPHIEQGAEAIVVTASGCGVLIKEYGHLLHDDPVYADRAARVSELARDLGEVIAAETLPVERLKPATGRVAFHSPCTLQHGQQLNGVVEGLLQLAGFELTEVADGHLCCGSAGTYSLLQPQLSQQLRDNKLKRLQAGKPDFIATANVGCQLHLGADSRVPVRHWIELLEEVFD